MTEQEFLIRKCRCPSCGCAEIDLERNDFDLCIYLTCASCGKKEAITFERGAQRDTKGGA